MSDQTQKKEVRLDSSRFDPLQIRLLQEIAEDVRAHFRATGIPEEKVREYTQSLTFSIAAIVDGSRVMELDGNPVEPQLTFLVDEEEAEIVGVDGGSWMHEYAIGTVEQMFENEEKDA